MPNDTFDIPAGGINPLWTPLEIVVLYWTIDTVNGNCKIDPTPSGRYDSSYFNGGVYSNIEQFAAALSDGTVPAAPSSPLYPNIGPNAQPWNFVIAKSCYVVYVLEQGMTQWQFVRGERAITTAKDQTGYYADLNHIVDDEAEDTVTGAGCVVAYLSAYVDGSNVTSSDQFALNVEYLQAGQWVILPDDPAIKNKGHNHGVSSNPFSLKLARTLLPDKLKEKA